MSDEPLHTASVGYALGRLQRALDTAANHADPGARGRATAKVEQWRAVIEGMHGGRLAVGSRTPVADTPAWVTLEVAHGGFATGRWLAEGELREHERALLATLPPEVPGQTERERLNRWWLGDAGQAQLAQALHEGRLHVVLPEEGALPVVAWLLEHGHADAALELVATLRPLMHRLRFYPELRAVPRPSGAMVRVCTVGEASRALRAVRPQAQVQAMNEALRVWNPLYDRLVALWLQTVDGEAPRIGLEQGEALARSPGGQPVIEGGWPCRRWPADWAAQRSAWLADYEDATLEHRRCGKHRDPRGNLARLRTALERCPEDSRALTGLDVSRIRQALAGTATRHGGPGSPQRQALRTEQAAIAARPSNLELARLVAGRLDDLPADGGLPGLEPVTARVREGESAVVAAGTEVPDHLVAKAMRALEAPIEELVERGVIGSAEVLAIVLPQITAQVTAAGLDDADLRTLYQQIYAAFRRRRSLLLLNLEHQVRLDELPWVAALAPMRQVGLGAQARARQALEQVTLLALSSFPHTIVPNPLVREMGALAKQAGLLLPLVEEVAADIFMGTFTTKWTRAAQVAAKELEGTLYARYYDLPTPAVAAAWDGDVQSKGGMEVAEGFAQRCKRRAREAGVGDGSWVAANGAVLEQSQILTTHNLTVLAHGLGLQEALRGLAPSLVEACLRFVVRRQQQHAPHFKERLQMLKNTAYAWRQALWFLSLCDEGTQWQIFQAFESQVLTQSLAWVERFAPVVAGLQLALEGGGFDADGHGTGRHSAKRFLGWSIGHHWLMPTETAEPSHDRQ
jgi:hypothetical protein